MAKGENICDFCKHIKDKKDVIYEDDRIFAMFAPEPSSVGHIIVMPKEHYPILEQVPDYIAADLFNKINKISSAVFEGIGAHGTNIIIQNGIAAGQKSAHFIVHVIARYKDDGLDFSWKPKQLSEEEMSTVELQLKEASKNIGAAAFEKEKPKPMELDKEPEKVDEGEELSDEENYLIKQLQRIP